VVLAAVAVRAEADSVVLAVGVVEAGSAVLVVGAQAVAARAEVGSQRRVRGA
jgi:hypothetical protein